MQQHVLHDAQWLPGSWGLVWRDKPINIPTQTYHITHVQSCALRAKCREQQGSSRKENLSLLRVQKRSEGVL